MPYAHSFTAEFYGNVDEANPCKRPTTVANALASMPDREWHEMAIEVFNRPGRELSAADVMPMVLETNTVSRLTSPVPVWIDPEGDWIVDVYDNPKG